MRRKQFKTLFLISLISFSNIALFAQKNKNETYSQQRQKVDQFLRILNYLYVDTIDLSSIVEKGTAEMLKELDPHSVYIPKKEVTRTNEPLQGNFEGVGVQFQIIKDTLVVVQPIKGGPAESVGITIGDKIIFIDDSLAVGKICTNDWVFKKLRGKKGTKVLVKIKRGSLPDLMTFTIIRDKIPINCIEAYFMVNKNTGYIKLERFSQTTHSEFVEAVSKLKAKGMENLIFDLRGNTGGFLNMAVELCDELLKPNRLIVYTKNNQDGNKISYTTRREGSFQDGKLVVLIDEYSASASEIVSGAVQDWDRGIIIGRRSFGKGLVQSQMMLPDSSMIRLTTSRYYIPSGRCIQKPYEGVEDYSRDVINRYNNGELIHADSIHFPDSLKFYTPAMRVVYGGGGIMPDIFVPIDTIQVSDYYWRLFRNNIFNQFVFSYLEKEKSNLLKQYSTFENFDKDFSISNSLLKDFKNYAAKEGIVDTMVFDFGALMDALVKEKKDTLNDIFANYASLKGGKKVQDFIVAYADEKRAAFEKRQAGFDTDTYIKRQLKTLIARQCYDANLSAKIWLEMDDTYKKALEVINNESLFKKMKIK